jgi:hypothetical protein
VEEDQGQERRLYVSTDVLNRLGFTDAALRKFSADYERVHGPLPRDERGRVWPKEAVERLESARAAVLEGSAVSVEQALRASVSGAVVTQRLDHSSALPHGRSERLADAVEQLLEELRPAVEVIRRRVEALEEANAESHEPVTVSRALEASNDQQDNETARRSVFIATPRESLPTKVYVLGILSVWIFSITDYFLNDLGPYLLGPAGSGPDLIADVMSLRAIAPLAFGFYIGFWRYDPIRWRFAGVAFLAALGGWVVAITLSSVTFLWSTFVDGWLPLDAFANYTATYLVEPIFLFMSGLVLGNALQRGIMPAPASASAKPAAILGQWSPKKQAILATVATVIGAMIGAVPNLIALFANGGGSGG